MLGGNRMEAPPQRYLPNAPVLHFLFSGVPTFITVQPLGPPRPRYHSTHKDQIPSGRNLTFHRTPED
ncbi:hypothetical protein PROFUN_14241 [Planoprotostelium fungivorum]|uniref:Uncharacterized protein n=1 Tax=Planoprotostelium fungivorum TaxID=1890364 RepID=A0A2P6N5P8_9EUKA|nr:hypothetical protein PROFUN_14241 [Planoprotostelium fungivorum]